MIGKIISGGQTGADRAALDAAIANGISHGGWLPAGRRTEDGPLSLVYALDELSGPSYPARTRQNVLEGDATLIVSHGPLTGGSALTADIAGRENKPWLHIDLDDLDRRGALAEVKMWLREHRPDVLNVAGPRASSDPMIYSDVYSFITAILMAS